MLFFTEGALAPAAFYAQGFPLKQTQSLLMTLDEIDAWVVHAKKHFGNESLASLNDHKEWLDMVENHTMDIRYVIEEGNDSNEEAYLERKRAIACILSAEDILVESLESVIDNRPHNDAILNEQRSKALAQTLASLTSFWIDQIHLLLKRLLSIITGDSEVVAILKRQELLAKLSF